jgi:hypothetical protein
MSKSNATDCIVAIQTAPLFDSNASSLLGRIAGECCAAWVLKQFGAFVTTFALQRNCVS